MLGRDGMGKAEQEAGPLALADGLDTPSVREGLMG